MAILRRVKLAYIGLTSAFLLLALLIPTGVLKPQEALNSVKWDVLGIYWGFMMLSMTFAASGVPEHLAKHILRRTKSEGGALLLLCAVTAFLSSFLENVGVVLIMAPIAVEVARKAKSSLFPYLVSIAVSSNIVTTVSMIADPPAIILASETGMSFLDFYWFNGRIGLGVISALGAVAGLLTLYLVQFRKMDKKIEMAEERIRMDYLPTALFIGGIISLSLNSYIRVGPGWIGLSVGVIALLLGRRNLRRMVTDFDWNSFFFIIGIFIVIGAVDAVGILEDFAGLLGGLSLSNPLIALIMLTWLSVGFSSFMDNVPYTVLMIPVCRSLAGSIGAAYTFPFLYGMIIGTGVGGNLTPVGATANVFACGMLEKRGYRIRLREYLRISAPITFVSVLVAQLLLQLLWM